MSPPPDRVLTRDVAMQAAEWYVRLNDGKASPSEHDALEAWRAQAPAHELAWQRALLVSRQAAAVPAALARPTLARPQRRRQLRTLALLIAAPGAGWLGWQMLPAASRTSAAYTTATGEWREWTLADGSRMVLDTASAADAHFGPELRRLQLHAGALLVETARDPQQPPRPFVVDVDAGRVRAVGTRFTVRMLDDRCRVAVLTGAVEIAPRDGGAPGRLQAGEQVDFDRHAVRTPRAAPADGALWARGVLAVEDLRLDEFLAELSRYRPGWIRCEPAVAGLRLSGAFMLNDTDAVLDNLARLLPVRVLERTRYWITVAPRGPR
ncbi:FecR domain-containing protein [Rubrivivax sp. JA1026]|uniref:FecR domain-containing protein n=1 Tax=Rubrivivax sp. JA1026 TaxID=2710888 RepID=UPI001F0FC9B7|nr:FecR domain-containing protein [Rubrivivax sp. JA1026]